MIMSTLQVQVMESLNGLSDENLSFLLVLIDKYMKPQKESTTFSQNASGGIKIGMFKGEKFIADDYDFDQDNDEVAKLFEVTEE